MPMEVVRTIKASARDVLDACRSVADDHGWKIISDRSDDGGLTFKTPARWSAIWGHHLDISVQPLGRFVLLTVWVDPAGIQSFDPTREGARLARRLTADVLDRVL